MGVFRLAHVDVTAPDLDLAAAYCTEVVGLQEVQRGQADGTDAAWFTCWDEQDHHSLRVRAHPRTGLDSVTFRVEREDDLHDLEGRLTRSGCRVTRVSRGEAVGQGESIRAEVPSGQIVELVWDVERTGGLLGRRNPAPVPPPGLPGIAPPRLDRVVVHAEEVGEAARFFQEVLGLQLTEQLLDGAGHQRGAWLAGRTGWPCDIAVLRGPQGALHHWAYRVDDWGHLLGAADLLAHHGVPVDHGPTRQGATRCHSLLFSDPFGVRNGLVAGGYRVDPDQETITWTHRERGRALNHHDAAAGRDLLEGRA